MADSHPLGYPSGYPPGDLCLYLYLCLCLFFASQEEESQ